MKLSIVVGLFLLVTSYGYTCGDHNNTQLNSDQAVIHHTYLKSHFDGDSSDKQFPDPNTNYDPNNRNHRGISTWRTTSLNGQRTLALTYDDGPHPKRTPALLDILKQHKVKATFFVMGELAKKYPKIIQRMVREGHIVASHDWRHDNSNGESREVFRQGLKDSILVVRQSYPGPHTYYRFPYGAYARGRSYHHFNVMKELSFELFGENCINFAFWDIDTSDWVSNMTAPNIVQTLKANLDGGKAWRFKTIRQGGRTLYQKEAYTITDPQEGGVVLMHDIHQRTIDATRLFLEEASAMNISFVLLKDVVEFEYGNLLCQLL